MRARIVHEWALAVAVAVAALASAHVLAAQVPGYQGDSRVRQVRYDSAEVVRVYTQRGIGTQIVLGRAEKIVMAAMGDNADAASCTQTAQNGGGQQVAVADWRIAACKGDSVIFLKPGLHAHDTNLIVHTDRRDYSFDLVVLPLKSKFGNSDVMYRVTFSYPDDAAAAASAAGAVRLIAQREAAVPAKRNEAYSMQAVPHSDDIEPSAVWDDGRFTYITIPDNRKVPTVFRLADDGTEHVPDKHMDGDTIVVHEVAKQWVLRLGDEAIEIWNNAFDLNGVPPVDGTTVPGVARVLKGGEHE
ncbi:TrbG/VirB9 family P-type conjugative transfer protein [Burkholderia pyrrocinia]|nr:TrbG/VirB9 family P-type conjugative transfer protein [Burkholderia pyrrocinia]